jgi:hypothetical protein
VKNRSRLPTKSGVLELLPRTVGSLAKAVRAIKGFSVELLIADWQSTDWPLDSWVYKKVGKLPTLILPVRDEFFSRGKGLNLAAKVSHGEMLFFTDADVLIPADMLTRIMACKAKNQACFPICWREDFPFDREKGRWITWGYGLCAVTREVWKKVGGWKEWSSWGGEDLMFFKKVVQVVGKRGINRPRVLGLIHQWHPHGVGSYQKPDSWHWKQERSK